MLWVDVTWGAGGSSADTTTEIVRTAHEQLGLETCMHLTCTNMPIAQVHQALQDAKEHGCENILALRGDPPNGQEEWSAAEGGFEHALDLVKYIRKHFGNHFDIAIAGFPEGHPHSKGREEELRHVKAKVDAGANFIITQMFYDADGTSASHETLMVLISNSLHILGPRPKKDWCQRANSTGNHAYSKLFSLYPSYQFCKDDHPSVLLG